MDWCVTSSGDVGRCVSSPGAWTGVLLAVVMQGGVSALQGHGLVCQLSRGRAWTGVLLAVVMQGGVSALQGHGLVCY